MKILIETNIMIDIFNKNSKFLILQKALLSVKYLNQKMLLCDELQRLNNGFRKVQRVFPSEVFIYEEFIDFSLNFYLDRLTIASLATNIKEIYKDVNIREFRKDILEFWNELKENKTVLKEGRNFIKMFDEVHEYALKHNRDLFIKDLTSLKELYRGANGNYYGDYERMIPKDKYAKDNRWNPDGKAFLYLGLNEENSNNDDINVGIQTCFEEIRAPKGGEVTICRFRAKNKACKLLDLTIDKEIVNYQENSLYEYIEESIDSLLGNNKFKKKAIDLAGNGGTKRMRKLIEKNVKNKVNKDKVVVTKYVSTMFLFNINEAIFLPVEKEKDPKLEAYIPFRFFAEYLMEKGYGGIIHKSTRMDMKGKKGKNVVLFNKEDASVCANSMQLYKREDNKDVRIK